FLFVSIGISAVLGLILGLLTFDYLNRINYKFPSSRQPYKTIAFESEHSDMVLPVDRLVDKEPNNYHTFFVWTQRLEYVPSFDGFNNAFSSRKDIVVLINPVARFLDDEIAFIDQYIKNGGKLLIMDDPENKNSTSNQLLSHFDIKIDFTGINNSYLINPYSSMKLEIEHAGSVEGGKSVFKSQDQKNYFTVKQYGKGFIGVMGDSSVFANKSMGDTQILPDQYQKQIYQLEFLIIKAMEKLK
ncbi:MAG: hypothetical protein HQK61_01950, partial [Desulfamplus sp.]|nr:hypothetical protein [Desulfamplus sp.]